VVTGMKEKIPNLILIYDIPDDAKRTKIADACLDYGLDRIQYSAFCGWLPNSLQNELLQKIRRILGKKPGNVQLIPICNEDWRKRKVIDQTAKET
jgi:CRISPR-associated protein Cas2